MKVVVIVLAAGASRRFGSPRLLAPLDGRPVLQHVLDSVAAAGLIDTVVVLGDDVATLGTAIAWSGERRVVNARPGDGLSSSLRVGLDAAAEDRTVDAVLVALGDQPFVRPEVITAVLDAAETCTQPIVRVRYREDGPPNPVLLRRSVWALAAGLDGDRGVAPLLERRPELVFEVRARGSNPDVDTTGDLERITRQLPGAMRVH